MLDPGVIGLSVDRNPFGTVNYVDAVPLDKYGTLDEVVGLDPGERIKRHRSYDVTAFVPTIDPEALRAAGTGYPKWVDLQYLQLPDVEVRVGVFAAFLQRTAKATNPYDTAKAIEDYLRQLPVDYDIPDTPPDRDPVDYFLNDLQRGYFDYHASAMVVMLRELGIPARLAVGFAVSTDDVDAETGAYVVRDKDSFAWPEVYFPGHGWVPFNPTPSRDAVIAPVKSTNPLEDDAIIKDGIRDIFDQLPVSASEGAFIPPEGVDIGQAPPSSAFFDDSGSSTSPWLMSAVSIFIALIIASVFFGWQRSVAGLPYPEQLWEKAVRLASWGGMPPEPGQTPHDYAARLARRFRAVDDWPALADSYTRSRFGRKETGEEEAEQLREAWPDARGALIGGILARPFRRWRRR
jgi:hypothetical protein